MSSNTGSNKPPSRPSSPSKTTKNQELGLKEIGRTSTTPNASNYVQSVGYKYSVREEDTEDYSEGKDRNQTKHAQIDGQRSSRPGSPSRTSNSKASNLDPGNANSIQDANMQDANMQSTQITRDNANMQDAPTTAQLLFVPVNVPNTSKTTPMATPLTPDGLQPSSIASQSTSASASTDIHSSLYMAATDSPHFRAHVAHLDSGLEGLTRWLEGSLKALKSYAEEIEKTNTATELLVGRLMNIGRTGLMNDKVVGCVRTFADGIQSVSSLKAKLIDDIFDQCVTPMTSYLKNELTDLRDSKRSFERLMDRYDSALNKHSNLNKGKEPSALREDAFQLYEIRKQYVKGCLDFATKLISAKTGLNALLHEQLVQTLTSHYECFDTSFQIFKGIQSQISALQIEHGQLRTLQRTVADELPGQRKAIEEEILQRHKPPMTIRAASAPNFDNASSVASGVGTSQTHLQVTNSFQSPQLSQSHAGPGQSGKKDKNRPLLYQLSFEKTSTIPIPDKAPAREGWLFKRATSSKALAPTWTRRYFILKAGGISYSFAPASGKNRGKVMISRPMNVLLCEIRVKSDAERRFVFEISSPRKVWQLQAETEEEMNSWIRDFEGAKLFAMQDEQFQDVVDSFKDVESEEDEEELGERLVAIQASRSIDGTNSVTPATTQSSPPTPPSTLETVPIADVTNTEAEPPSPTRPKSGYTSPRDDDKPAISYPKSQLARRNEELHQLLKSVPKSDYVIDVFTCALQRDILLHGRIYVTQNRICFHSNILGYVTVLVLHLKEVTDIQRRRQPFNSSIIISTITGQYTFKTFFKDDLRTFGVLKAVWNNSQDNYPLSVQELFDSVWTNYLENPDSSTGQDDKVATGTSGPGKENVKDETADSAKQSTSPSKTQQQATFSSYEPASPPKTLPKCACADHPEKKEAEITINLPAKKVFELLMGEDWTFWRKYHEQRGDKEMKFDAWKDGTGKELKIRDASYIIPMNNPMVKVKETDCIEKQVILKQEEHLVYVFETRQSTPKIQFGDAFSPFARFCVTYAGPGKCKVVVHSGVIWYKSPFVKSIIRSAAMKGLAESTEMILESLRAEAKSSGSPADGDTKIADSTGKESVSSPRHGKQPSLQITNRRLSMSLTSSSEPLPKWVWAFAIALFMSLILNVHTYWSLSISNVDSLIDKEGHLENVCTNWWVQPGIHLKLLTKEAQSSLVQEFLKESKSFNVSNPIISSNVTSSAPSSNRESYLSTKLSQNKKKVRDLKQELERSMRTVRLVEQQIAKTEFVSWAARRVQSCTEEECKEAERLLDLLASDLEGK